MIVYLANPRGFCAGVVRAVDIVERALDIFGAPIYVRHAIVHNRFVVDDLKSRGVVFVEALAEVPRAATVVFSAHGVSQSVRREAERRGLRVFDATCPLVTKVHAEVARYRRQGIECILIGHAGHPEVEGTMGQFIDGVYLVENSGGAATVKVRDHGRLAYVTQTTLSMDDTAQIVKILRNRFPQIHSPKRDDICYATQNRQDAVRRLAARCDLVLVVGSPTSSNSNRLCEVARSSGADAQLIDSAGDIDAAWLRGRSTIGVTAGASAPEHLVRAVIEHLKRNGATEVVELDGTPETISFPTPKSLQKIA